MPEPRPNNLRLLLADPDPARRRAILAGLPGASVIEAASMPEAFDLAESQEPSSVAMAVDLSGDPGLPMFLRLVDALSADFVMFGDPGENRTPLPLQKAVEFMPLGRDTGPSCVIDRLNRRPPRSEPAPSGAANAGTRSGRIIGIGASTGGVSALETVLTAFPRDCPPTLVVQHIRAGFIEGMIARLDGRCAARVVAARDGETIEDGTIYVAADPARHLVLQPGPVPRCRLRPEPPRHGHRPAVDSLFETMAACGSAVSAALLTGMGADGASGLGRIRSAGGRTIAQDEASCVVYGMPRAAVELGAAGQVLPIDRIAGALLEPDRSAGPAPVCDGSEELAR
jgi:two-component system chemotaxis response regulator CheB